MSNLSVDMPWVIFQLSQELFAISSGHVREMVAMPRVVPVSNAPSHIRGVINLRSSVIPVVDLRLRLGLVSSRDERESLVMELERGEQSHNDWLEELEGSLKENRAFELTSDPHQCAFGRWYDGFTSNNRILEGCLRQFDEPHKKVHAVADKVLALAEAGQKEEAFALIEQVKSGELNKLKTIFAEAKNLLRDGNKEIALVLQWEEKQIAISVDSVSSVERIQEANIENTKNLPYALNSEFVAGIAKRVKENDLVQIISVENLIGREEKLDYSMVEGSEEVESDSNAEDLGPES